MKITINAFGTRGDVQPYIALGLGLTQRGHMVRIATHRIFESFIREHHLGFFPLEIDPRQVLISQAVAEFGNNTFRITRWMEENFRPTLQHIFQITLNAARDADIILNSSLSLAGWHIAEKLGIPAIGTYLWPVTPTRAFPSASVPNSPSWLPFKGIYNRLSTKLANQFFFSLLRPIINECRQEVLDLPPQSALYYWRIDSPRAKAPLIYAFSPTVVPRPMDWGKFQQISGYWFLDAWQEYKPPDDLVDFLDSGPPPVYVGFGSMVDHEQEHITHLVVEALQRAGQRGVLLGGWSDLGNTELPDSIIAADFIPHDWLFPHMATVVHHGGAGTTAAGLRAGIPTVVVSFFGDQPFWGWRVYEIGAGPKWIPRTMLTADNLASAIRQAVSDQKIKQSVSRIGSLIRAEDGVSCAVDLIEMMSAETELLDH